MIEVQDSVHWQTVNLHFHYLFPYVLIPFLKDVISDLLLAGQTHHETTFLSGTENIKRSKSLLLGILRQNFVRNESRTFIIEPLINNLPQIISYANIHNIQYKI